jgi:hypothetical protein
MEMRYGLLLSRNLF